MQPAPANQNNSVSIIELRENLIDEIFKAAGFSDSGMLRKIGGSLFNQLARRFATIAARFDQVMYQSGFPAAAQDALNHFNLMMQVRGAENIPYQGPVLIAGNHPGSFDALCVLANLPRQDVYFIVSGVPLTHSLPNTSPHLIYAPSDKHERMLAIRAMTRHLQEGRAVFILPSGRLDPDPDVLPGAEQALELWSPSLDILLRRVPETQVVIAITSGVLAPQVLHHPVTRLQKSWRRQKLAEFIQVGQMLFNPHKYELHPRITFSSPWTIPAHSTAIGKQGYLPELIEVAKNTLHTHQSWNSLGESAHLVINP